ncbi:MAG: fascin domain-containing protein [Thermoanaerobaculia bacterium]
MRNVSIFLFLILGTLLGLGSASAQCRSDDRSSPDVTAFYADANHDLSDYGVIFEDAGNSGCAQAASVALYKKVKATLGYSWPVYDAQVNLWVYAYQGWLQGANVTLIYAAALRLGAQGKLTKPLDDLLEQISYPGNIDAHCGFDNGQWTSQNSCMDDYTVTASGFAWRAAYQYYTGRNSYLDAQSARSNISLALSNDRSICVYLPYVTPPNPAPSRGPCTGNIWDLRLGNADALGLHNGDAIPYGLGLMTSIASAAAGLSYTPYPLSLTNDEKDYAYYLRLDGRVHSDPSGSVFLSNCYSFSKGASGELVVRTDFPCYEPGYGPNYRPMMFPVKSFYDGYVYPDSNAYAFDQFDESLFCSNYGYDAKCGFYHPGRREIYKTLAADWIVSPPALSGAKGDYTASFRTYYGYYLSAANGGGSSVNAQPTGIGTYEQFSLVDLNGGPLMDGDPVTFQSANGSWVVAESGGNSTVNANRASPHEWETFTIHKNGGGVIYNGDNVSLSSYYGYYVVAEGGGGGQVNCNRTAAAQWETFTISLAHN